MQILATMGRKGAEGRRRPREGGSRGCGGAGEGRRWLKGDRDDPENKGVGGRIPITQMQMRRLLDELQCVSVPIFADDGENKGTAEVSLRVMTTKMNCSRPSI